MGVKHLAVWPAVASGPVVASSAMPGSFARLAAFLPVVVTSFSPAVALAQGLPLQRYYASEVPEDGFAVSRPIDRGHDRWGAHAHLVYSLDPLVYESTLGDSSTEVAPIIENQVSLDVGLSWGLFDRLIVYAGLPVHLLMTGEARGTAAGPDEATLGDPWLGARVRIYGENDEVASVGAQATLTLPLADGVLDGQHYSGETSVSFVPKLLVEIRPGPVRITANLGLRIRDEHDVGSILVRNELIWGLGAAVRLYDDEGTLDGILEAVGSHSLDYFGRRETLSVEMLGGLEYFAKTGFNAGLAGGPGLSRGYGTPDLRIVLTIGYVEPLAAAAPPPPPPSDRDEDGIADDADQCPDDAEDLDEYQDEDGCPDLDDDDDGVVDTADECVEEPEDRDGVADEDGCPESDADEDGIADGTTGARSWPRIATASKTRTAARTPTTTGTACWTRTTSARRLLGRPKRTDARARCGSTRRPMRSGSSSGSSSRRTGPRCSPGRTRSSTRSARCSR